MKQLIGLLKKEFETEKVFMAGGSMGGTSSLIFSAKNPDLISGILALCPATDMRKLYYQWRASAKDFLAGTIEFAYGGTPETIPEEYEKRSVINYVEVLHSKPVAITHGDADNLIDVEHSRSFVIKASDCGVKVFYHEIKDGDHDSPVKDFGVVERPLLWLLSFRE